MATVVTQKSHQADISLYLESKHSPLLGVCCTSKSSVRPWLSKQAVTPENKICGGKPPTSSLWVERDSDLVCNSGTCGTGGDKRNLAEKEATAVFGAWSPKSFFFFFFLVSSSWPQVCVLFLSCPQFIENHLFNMLGNAKFKEICFLKTDKCFF